MAEDELVRMTPQESSILCMLVQNRNLPEEQQREFLEQLSPRIRGIGRALCDETDVTDEERRVAEGIKEWAAGNASWKKS